MCRGVVGEQRGCHSSITNFEFAHVVIDDKNEFVFFSYFFLSTRLNTGAHLQTKSNAT